jgi:hypothetical protein
MEIFTNEFKNLLSTQLEELTNVVKTEKAKENPQVMSDYEIAKAIEDCMNNPDCGKKEKKKKNKKFKVGDVVYWGNIEGIVEETIQYNSFLTIWVVFKSSGDEIEFTEDGRFSPTLPIILSHFPYELKMKKIK